MKKIVLFLILFIVMVGEVEAVMKKGIGIVTETNNPDASVPPEITDKDIGYLKDIGVDFVNIAPGWYRLACRDPHLNAVKITSDKTIYASSEINTDFRKENMFDGNPATAWSSVTHDSEEVVEWISVDLGAPKNVNKIVLTPRFYNKIIQAFPKDFNFSYSDDGKNWQILPGMSFNNYPTPLLQPDGTAPQVVFNIISPIPHRYFGFGATKATQDDYKVKYLVQIADISFMEVQNQYSADDPNNPAYNWAFLDRSINRVVNAGIQPIIYMTGTPRWLTEDNVDSCWSEPLYADFLDYSAKPPSKYGGTVEFGHFMKAMAQRYKGKVSIYSLWNEPNFHWFWTGTMNQYVAMINYAYNEIKSVDPAIEVWAGNTSPAESPLYFFNEAKSLGIKFDVWAHHFYPLNNTIAPWLQQPQAGQITLNNASVLIEAVGNKPIANSESGYYISCGVGCGAATSEANQASWMDWSMKELAKYPQIRYFTNFMLYKHPGWGTGFLMADSGQKFEAYNVFKNYVLPTPTPVPCTDSDNGKIYTVKGNTCQGANCSTDVCNSVGLVEYYCSNNQVVGESHLCGAGNACSEGKCVVVPTNTPVPPTATPTIILGDYDGNGVVDSVDFGEWKKRYLAVPPTMTLVDFGVWKKAYLTN